MAKKTVVQSTCDRCHKEATTDLPAANKRGQDFEIPEGWIHIHANSKTATLFEMDLCDECKVIVLEAAGVARGK